MSKKAITIIVVIVVLIGLGVGGYFLVKSNKNSSTTTTEQVSTADKVDISDFKFKPVIIKVKKGTKVTWANNDSVAHNVVADNGSFRSNTLSKGQEFSFTFDNASEFSYICTFHSYMKGKVIVE